MELSLEKLIELTYDILSRGGLTMNAILQVENLTKQYADFKLDHVSFSVPKEQSWGLLAKMEPEKAQLSMLFLI